MEIWARELYSSTERPIFVPIWTGSSTVGQEESTLAPILPHRFSGTVNAPFAMDGVLDGLPHLSQFDRCRENASREVVKASPVRGHVYRWIILWALGTTPRGAVDVMMAS